LKGFAYNVQAIKLFIFSCMLSLSMSGQAEESLAQAAIHQFAEQGNAKVQAKLGAMYLFR
jgi:hypothetical protein